MRITRVLRLKFQRKKRNKLLFNFFVAIPIISIVMGYLITDILILPIWAR